MLINKVGLFPAERADERRMIGVGRFPAELAEERRMIGVGRFPAELADERRMDLGWKMFPGERAEPAE
jgi:hypothetical protein